LVDGRRTTSNSNYSRDISGSDGLNVEMGTGPGNDEQEIAEGTEG
jgi:hypothetical protein